jgi:hypothetical protein
VPFLLSCCEMLSLQVTKKGVEQQQLPAPAASKGQAGRVMSPLLQLVGVAVVVATMSVRTNGLGLRRRGATMGGLAAGNFELDGGVSDLEALTQGALDIGQDIAALGHRHFGDGNVAGERVGLRTKAPDMKIVNVENAVDRGHGLTDLTKLEVARSAFEQDIERLANDTDGAPEDHCGDEDGEHRVDPGHARKKDGCATGDDCCGGERVAEHVEEDATDVDVA